ncbi:hypothetical protein ACKGJI_03395 [Sulfurospirillum sp. 1307]|jgi:hypothetical protein
MQKKVTLALFAFLIIALGVVLYSLLKVDDSKVLVNADYLSPSVKIEKNEIKDKSWAENLAGANKSNFTYPINELFMQIDLKNYIPPKIKSYRLVVDRADRYSMFCIMQTLSSMNLPFVLEKKGMVPTIYVGSKTKDNLLHVVNKLKDYDIESKIIEVWL